MSAPGVSSTIDADPSPFFRALNDVERATKSTFNRVEGSVKSLVGPIDAVLGGFGRLNAVLGAGAIVLAGRRAIQLGDDLDKAATKAGVTGETISSLSYAAKLADVDLGSLSTSLKFMQVNLSQAGDGAKGPVETLRALGLAIEDLLGLAPDKQFELIADRISQLEDPADRARAATEMFGRAGSALLPMFEEGAEGIRRAREEAERLGIVLNDQQIKTLSETDDKVKKMTASWDHFAGVLTGKVAPAIQAVLDLLSFNVGSPQDFQKDRSTADLEAFLGRLESGGALTGGEQKTLEFVRQELARRRAALGTAVQSVFASGASALSTSAAPGYQPPPEKPGKAAKPERLQDISEVSVASTVAIGKEQAREGKKEQDLAENALAHARALAQAQVDIEAEKLQQMAELGQITRVQEIAGLQELEARRYEIDREALTRKANDMFAEPIERQKANNELESLELDHQQRMQELHARGQELMAGPWRQLFGTMQAGFQGVLQNFFRGYASIGATLRGLAASVLDVFTDMIAKIIAQWLTMKVVQLLFSKSTIAGKAAEAGAGGVASMAGAPFPLNLSAPVFGAAMAALAAGYLAIPAAAGGWDLPKGINPVTQLHSGEMVLPESLADVVRSAAGGGGVSSGQAPNVSLSVSTIDASGFAAFLRNGGLAQIKRELMRGQS